MKKLMAIVVTASAFVSESPAQNAPCNWPLTVVKNGTLKSGETYTTKILFSERTEQDLVSAVETTQIDASSAQASFPSRVQGSSAWADLMSKKSCNLRINNASFSLAPNGSSAAGTIRVTAEKWGCVSADVPCPTWREPLRLCRKGVETKLAGTNITSTIPFSLTHNGDTVNVATGNAGTSADTSWEQRFVLDLVGGSLAGIGGAFATDYFQNQILSQISGSVNSGLGGISVPEGAVPSADAVSVPSYNPHITQTSFVDLGGGKLGVQIVRTQDAIRKGTACFLGQSLAKNP